MIIQEMIHLYNKINEKVLPYEQANDDVFLIPYANDRVIQFWFQKLPLQNNVANIVFAPQDRLHMEYDDIFKQSYAGGDHVSLMQTFKVIIAQHYKQNPYIEVYMAGINSRDSDDPIIAQKQFIKRKHAYMRLFDFLAKSIGGFTENDGNRAFWATPTAAKNNKDNSAFDPYRPNELPDPDPELFNKHRQHLTQFHPIKMKNNTKS